MQTLLFTHPIPEKGFQAGKIYPVPDEEAAVYLEKDQAILSAVNGETEVSIPSKKGKGVKHDNG